MNKIVIRSKKFVLALFICALVGSIAYGSIVHHDDSIPKPVAKLSSSYKLVFDDEFNGQALDKAKWNTCYESYDAAYHGCTNYGNNEDEWYEASQVQVQDGHLTLTAQKQTTPGNDKSGQPHTYGYRSGMVASGSFVPTSSAKWGAKYGYFEARIKVPQGQAVWPAFWLLPTNHKWPPEIDVMEVLGQRPKALLTTYYWPGQSGATDDSSTHIADDNLSQGWHTYSINWGPGTIDWYLDGKLVKHVSSANVPDENMYVLLNLAIGGNLPGYPNATTPSKLQMLVDYVRVYQK